ncbi:MAG TPA: SWIB/MDM2 domain-containing protein [Bdellovibrionota bacterium]|nr:SWIB/MDM2 domain-containing protein [Bdellovibrionota bacterium]
MATKKKAKTAKKTAKKATSKGKKTAKKVAKKTAKSTVKKTAKKAAKATKKTAKVKTKRKPNAKFMAPLKVSDALAAVVGNKPLPRTEVTKKLWAYIKKNNLQDKVQRRNINADDKLKAIFGGRSQVSMFEMTKLVSKHLSA